MIPLKQTMEITKSYLGGSRIENTMQPTFFDLSVSVKKILTYTAVHFTFECGFLRHIAGTTLKAQEQHFDYALVLFYCLKIFFKFFSESATNSCCVGSYCAERGIEGKQPSLILTQKGGENMKSSSFEQAIQAQFDCLTKKSH